MSDVRLHATVHGEELRIRTNLGELDACHHASVFGALAAHLGYDPEPMRKAVFPRGEGEDPRYKSLFDLIRFARRDWETYSERLVKAVRELLDDGRLLPMTPRTQGALMELLADHEQGFIIKFAGRDAAGASNAQVQKLIAAGIISPESAALSYIEASYRLGSRLKALEVHRIGAPTTSTLEGLLQDAMQVQLAPADVASMRYATNRGAIHMRRPWVKGTTEAQRILNEAEYAAVRPAIAGAVRQKWSSRKLARELKSAVRGNPSLINDWQRVARTELVQAHNMGAYIRLKTELKAAGITDPFVYKFTSPLACQHCRRIWGIPTDVKKYRLSFVERREAAGGNFGIKAKEWGPVIGPVHPNCTEGPLQVYHPELVDSIVEGAAEVMAYLGKKPVTR